MSQNAQGWHPKKVLAEIQIKHGSCRVFAATLGVAPSLISQTLASSNRSKRMERAIALTLGVPLHTIWPDRWTEDGRPGPRSQRIQIAVPSRTISSQKQKVA